MVWDMEATIEELREVDDAIEKMHDTSHTRILSREEFWTPDINGGAKTGFEPYWKNGKIWFEHRWLLLIGLKK